MVRRLSWSSPIAAAVDGRKFSMKTSAVLSSRVRTSLPSAVRRSTAMLRLLRFEAMK